MQVLNIVEYQNYRWELLIEILEFVFKSNLWIVAKTSNGQYCLLGLKWGVCIAEVLNRTKCVVIFVIVVVKIIFKVLLMTSFVVKPLNNCTSILILTLTSSKISCEEFVILNKTILNLYKAVYQLDILVSNKCFLLHCTEICILTYTD